MKKTIFSIILLTVLILPSFAQVPILVDQFSKISLEDLLSRLDYLTSELIKNQNSTALIKVYGGKEDLKGFPYRYAAMIKTYLTNRKIDEKKILTQQCDGEKETKFEIHIIPPNAKISNCEKSLIIPEKTLRFDSYRYSFEYPGFDDCCAIIGSDRASAVASLKAFAELLKKSLESETLSRMLSPKKFQEHGSAHIGSLLTRKAGEVPVVLSVKDVVSTHLAILASTGSGKSYTAGVIVEELMQPHNGAAVLIVDPHGEYHTMQSIQGDAQFHADGYKPEVKIFTPEKIKVRFSTLTEADVKYLLPEGTSDKMAHFLSQAFTSLHERLKTEKRADYAYAYHDLRDEVNAQKFGDEKKDGGNVSSIDGLLWRMDSRFGKSDSIFTASEHIELNDLFKPGRCTILQLSDIEQHEQQVIVGALLRRVNKARVSIVRGEVPKERGDFVNYPVFTLLEEAHRFAPAGASVVSTNILKQILSEGRKFGVGIGLITQRPGKLDQDVLSQCMTQIIMRIVNPIDQQTVAQSVEGAGRAMLAELPALTKGQAVISGVGVNTPVMCRIRQRLTAHGGETFDAPSEWMKWHSSDAQDKREQDNAPYLKQSSDKKTEKVGNIRI